MKNNIPFVLIDTAGQTTAVIGMTTSRKDQPGIAIPIMKSVKDIGQVCFIEIENGLYRLQMMGNELSVNGSLAGAFYLANKLNTNKFLIKLSGLQSIATYDNKFITFPNLIRSIENDIVELDGIIYKLIPKFVKPQLDTEQKNILSNLASKYGAAGLIFYKKNKIQPVIYVKATNTYVWETCCGSASIAYAAFSCQRKIVQPSKETVLIKICAKDVIYSARCGMLE